MIAMASKPHQGNLSNDRLFSVLVIGPARSVPPLSSYPLWANETDTMPLEIGPEDLKLH